MCDPGISSWHAEQEVQGPIPGFAATISESGYLLLPSRNVTEISLKATLILKTINQSTNLKHDISEEFIYQTSFNLNSCSASC